VSDFRVVLEVFEGPLDLLLTLVRRSALDITTVALARVTDSYLRYLATLEALDAGALAAFCEVAGTLILIKSQALLPRPPEPPPDEEGEAEALLDRLRAYRAYRRVAERLGERERAGLRAYVRLARPPETVPILDPGAASVSDLTAVFEAALAEAGARDEPAPTGTVAPHRVRLTERLSAIRDLLLRRRRVSFRDVLLGERRDREFVIVSFLAVLELLRRGFVRARQSELFGDILLELRPDAPAALPISADDDGGD